MVIKESERKAMTEEFQEYVTFTTTNKDGEEIEMAIIDEFEFQHRNYVVGAVIEDDTINEDGLYIYRAVVGAEDFTVEKITDAEEYEKAAEAYLEME